ncbi:neuronal acetylcholine receptor subunit alpha-7-like [Xenia sp. Carnegie-2017]|uniref:neuronal acetylcholine receptor subunit alpha-7-like n=1 Tax=Xenia sp. Carnegie-2017 TaxID=2897299 RepID=UPI001F04516F|nr:neuronal acetylcholine receptor subunit alpha-7-like [Xenia sp. Carnegie-2017]
MKFNILYFYVVAILGDLYYMIEGRYLAVQERLFEDLLKNYRKNWRPVHDQECALPITFNLQLVKILDVNAKLQRMSVLSTVYQEWQDEYLRWNSSQYSGFTSINISPSKIWVPDLQLYNEVENKDHKKTGISTKVIVYSNGTCRWSYPLFIHVMCSIDVSYFPLDLQKCFLMLGSMTYTKHEIIITQPRKRHITPSYKNEEWTIYESSIKAREFWDEKRENSYSVVEISLSMERGSLYFITEMLIPCFLIACLTILGFFLPPASGERISLCMLILLAMTFFQQLTMKIIPLQDFPIISQYFSIMTVEIGFTLVMTSLTLNFHYHSPSKMPDIMKKIIINCLGKVTRVTPSTNKEKKTSGIQSRRVSKQCEKDSHNVSNHDETKSDEELRHSRLQIKTQQTDSKDLSTEWLKVRKMDENTSTQNQSNFAARTANTDINHCTKDEEQQNKIIKEQSDLREDWVLASRIIDNFCMYTAGIVGILTMIVVFSRAPRFWRNRSDVIEQ